MSLYLTGRALGARFERIAWGYLVAKGFRILARNYHCGRAEIDLIGSDGEMLVFVEVKGRCTDRFGEAVEAVDPRKFARLRHAARHYLHRHRVWGSPCRFDVVTILLIAGVPHITHFQHVFSSD